VHAHFETVYWCIGERVQPVVWYVRKVMYTRVRVEICYMMLHYRSR